jgi:hypothetical protein
VFGVVVLSPAADLLHRPPKRIRVSGSIIASGLSPRQTTEGRNRHTYLLQLATSEGEPQIVKLSYRFMHRDSDLPPAFFDPAVVHTFKAVRDPECDERFDVLSTAYVFDERGFTLTGTRPALQFVTGSPAPQIAADKVLACYITTPEDYVSSRLLKEHDTKQR